MRSDLQQRINPMTPQPGLDFNTSSGKIATNKPATDDADFLKILNNSNQDTQLEREAKKNGDLSGAKNYQDFLKKLEDNTKKQREPKNTLEKDDFLKLFVTQLKHQDPLNPSDSTEMASKLAQFNSLEQMLNVNKTLTQMLDTQKETRSVDMVNYVGKEINIDGGRVRVKNGLATEGVYKLSRPAANTRVEVRDSSGTVVLNKELGSMESGEYKFNWDGLVSDGKKAPNGSYSFGIIAKDIDDRDVTVELSSKTKISGVDIQDKEGALFTDLGKVKLSDIKSIGSDGFAKDEEEVKKAEAEMKKVQKPAAISPDKIQEAIQLSQTAAKAQLSAPQAAASGPQKVVEAKADNTSKAQTISEAPIVNPTPTQPMAARS